MELKKQFDIFLPKFFQLKSGGSHKYIDSVISKVEVEYPGAHNSICSDSPFTFFKDFVELLLVDVE